MSPSSVLHGGGFDALDDVTSALDVQPHDLVVTSATNAVRAVNEQIESVLKNINLLKAQSGHTENDEEIIRKNARYRSALKPFGESEFQIARVPVTFTFQNKERHSQVGYIDNDRLEMVGFKSANLGGYTVLYDQLVVGINPNAIYDRVKLPESDKVDLVRKTIKVPVTKFHNDKPVKVNVKRPREYVDLVEPLRKRLEAQTRQQWTLMSDKPASARGVEGQWFWLMPTHDVKRLSSVFPGGFFKVSNWGLAF